MPTKDLFLTIVKVTHYFFRRCNVFEGSCIHQGILNQLFFMSNELRRAEVIHFVDIGGIVDHHCLNFLLIAL
jgi:hypothetical protein